MACDAGAEPHLRIATVLCDSNGLSAPSLVLMSSRRIGAGGAAQRNGGLGTKSGAHAPEERSSCTSIIFPWCACARGLRCVPCGFIPSSVPAEGAVALYSARHLDDNTAAARTATTTSRRLDQSNTTRACATCLRVRHLGRLPRVIKRKHAADHEPVSQRGDGGVVGMSRLAAVEISETDRVVERDGTRDVVNQDDVRFKAC